MCSFGILDDFDKSAGESGFRKQLKGKRFMSELRPGQQQSLSYICQIHGVVAVSLVGCQEQCQMFLTTLG